MSEVDVVAETRHAIVEARRKRISVHEGTPCTAAELEAIERELGVRLPTDYRTLALAFGALLFRSGGASCCCFGKASAETASTGLDLDIRTQTLGFRENEILFDDDAEPSPIVTLGARIDEEEGHFELVLGDSIGRYRQLFNGGRVSPPRILISSWSMFPFFVKMFDDSGTRLPAEALRDKITRGE